jgi:hypothetical protein
VACSGTELAIITLYTLFIKHLQLFFSVIYLYLFIYLFCKHHNLHYAVRCVLLSPSLVSLSPQAAICMTSRWGTTYSNGTSFGFLYKSQFCMYQESNWGAPTRVDEEVTNWARRKAESTTYRSEIQKSVSHFYEAKQSLRWLHCSTQHYPSWGRSRNHAALITIRGEQTWGLPQGDCLSC